MNRSLTYSLTHHPLIDAQDFNTENALPLLERYRYSHLVFNDDVQVGFSCMGRKLFNRAAPCMSAHAALLRLPAQGTAATALAGLYGAMHVMGLPPAGLKDQRVLCLGAGSAGMGVVWMIHQGGYLSVCGEGRGACRAPVPPLQAHTHAHTNPIHLHAGMKKQGLPSDQAYDNFHIVDHLGLITGGGAYRIG